MADPQMMAQLLAKRDDLSRDLVDAERKVSILKAALTHVEGTIRLFDPEAVSRPARRRVRARAGIFPHGQMSRIVLDIMRRATEPMSAREITEQIYQEHAPDIDHALLAHRVLSRLNRQAGKLVHGEWRGSTKVWSLA